MGAWEGYENAKGKTPGEQWAAAIIGGAKELDNLAVSAGAGALAFTAASPFAPMTLGTAPALAATASGIIASELYTETKFDRAFNDTLDMLEPALAIGLNISFAAIDSAYSIAEYSVGYAYDSLFGGW